MVGEVGEDVPKKETHFDDETCVSQGKYCFDILRNANGLELNPRARLVHVLQGMFFEVLGFAIELTYTQ